MKVGREVEARPSADVERRFADEAREREDAAQRVDEQVRAAELKRRVAHALVALERVREMVEHDRSAARFIDRACRWLRNQAG